MAFGGPDNYIGKVNYNLFYFNKFFKKDMRNAHSKLKLTEQHFN